METRKKKEWQTPKLLVLCRARMEERVLAACKTGSVSGPTGETACTYFEPICQGQINT